MKKIVWWLSLAVVAALFSSAPVTRAQEPERKLMERLERLEQHVQGLTAAMEHEKHLRAGRPEEPRGPMPPRMDPARPVCPPGALCPPPMPSRCARCVVHALLALLVVLHILLAIWVYGDVQKRGVPGRAIFIVLVLLAGIPMSILYALVRIGDKVGEKPS